MAQFRQKAALEDEILEARAEIAATGVVHARTLRELRAAEARVAATREAERERLSRLFFARKCALVAQLDRALAIAAKANAELAQLERDETAVLGHREWWAWGELHEPTATNPTRYHDWRRAAVAQGLIEK